MINTKELVKSIDMNAVEERARKATQDIANQEIRAFFAKKTGLGADLVKECVDELMTAPELKASVEEKLLAAFNRHLPDAIDYAAKRFAANEANAKKAAD